MIKYNPKEWFSLIFQFHKSDTFRILFPAMVSISLYAWLIAYIEIEVLQLKFKTSTTIHSLLGFVISLLLVFRTNTAYERWWEGRRLWGSLINNSRNLMIKICAFLPDNKDAQQYLGTLLSNYAFSLKYHLRDIAHVDGLSDCAGFNKDSLLSKNHKPNFVALLLFKKLNDLHTQQQLSGEQLIVLNEEFRSLAEICGACERIKKTPIPFSYSLFLKKFIFAYIMTMPFGFLSDFGYWIIVIIAFVFYVLASLELIAEEIEQPFGSDPNDLPLDDMSLTIKRNIQEIIAG